MHKLYYYYYYLILRRVMYTQLQELIRNICKTKKLLEHKYRLITLIKW